MFYILEIPLLILMGVAYILAVLFASEHADILSISERPLNAHDKNTARRYLVFALVTIFIGVVLSIVHALIRGDMLDEYFSRLISIIVLSGIPFVWIVSYLIPSKRKKEVTRRKKFRNTLLF